MILARLLYGKKIELVIDGTIVLTSAIKGQGVEDILRACELVWEDYNIQHKTSFINRCCEGVIVCDSREMRAKRQVVEGVRSQIKLFNAGSGWMTLTCVLVYVFAYAIGYSYYRRGELEV